MHWMAECDLDADQHVGKGAGWASQPPCQCSTPYLCFPQNSVGCQRRGDRKPRAVAPAGWSWPSDPAALTRYFSVKMIEDRHARRHDGSRHQGHSHYHSHFQCRLLRRSRCGTQSTALAVDAMERPNWDLEQALHCGCRFLLFGKQASNTAAVRRTNDRPVSLM